MGIFFGISDLPVSTIMTPFENFIISKPPIREINDYNYAKDKIKYGEKCDVFVSKQKHISDPFVRVRNVIEKLMSHYSKKIIK